MIVLKFNRYFIPIQEDKKSQVPKHDMIGLINTERPAFKITYVFVYKWQDLPI